KTIYGAEGSMLDIIDGTTDKIVATETLSDGSTIVGLGVDEAHGRTYMVTTKDGMTELFALEDGPLHILDPLRPPLLTPRGQSPIAVDGPGQQVFVLGVDSNGEGEIVTLDGPSGAPTHLAQTSSHVDPSVSGIVLLGDATAANLLVKPNIVKPLGRK